MNLETLCRQINSIAESSTNLTETLNRLNDLIKEQQ